jgi:hypothetical protein
MMASLRIVCFFMSSLLPCLSWADEDSKINWSSRARFADFSGAETARAASLLVRVTAENQWNEQFSTLVQVDNVNRAFKNEHSDGVELNGKPIIPDAEGVDLNQAYAAVQVSDFRIKLGRQKINWDDQRFIGGNGFWQNEQTFDALLTQYKFLNNSQFSYAYIDNVNRIFGDDADKYITTKSTNNSEEYTARPTNLWGDYKQKTHIAQLNLNEWDYSQLTAYAYHINNTSLPSTSNNTLGAKYTFTYKLDSIIYHAEIASARQTQPESISNQSLAYYLLNGSLGIKRFEIGGRYEILSHEDGINFITPLSSMHDFQGSSNQIYNYMSQGLRDASLNITWRATPFKFESQYHRFYTYTNKQYLAQELDLSISYKPTRKHSVTLLVAQFEPEQQPAHSFRRLYLDYAYNF